jgi:hypothetical protein
MMLFQLKENREDEVFTANLGNTAFQFYSYLAYAVVVDYGRDQNNTLSLLFSTYSPFPGHPIYATRVLAVALSYLHVGGRTPTVL